MEDDDFAKSNFKSVWINGCWRDPSEKTPVASFNPANGEVIATFLTSGKAEAECAISAARTSFEKTEWRRSPALRSHVLLEIAKGIESRADELARQLTFEGGKTFRETRAEVAAAVSEARYYAGLARNLFGRTVEIAPRFHSMLARDPLGVIGIIVPWNAPITLLIRSLAPVLAAGCTTVIKAAPQTAITSLRLFALLSEIKTIPPGVINGLVETGNQAAKTLVSSPHVDGISFTGSTEVGKSIMAAAAPTLKRVNLELGGNAPCIVLADADVSKAAEQITRAGMLMTGQFCCSASHVYVHESRADEVLSRLNGALSSMVIGPGWEPDVDIGPMIDIENRDRILQLVEKMKQTEQIVLEGCALGGRLSSGAFISPSLILSKESCPMLHEQEVFGPVLSVSTFNNEEEAIAKANSSRFGLAASIWGTDLSTMQRIAFELQAGTVWLNAHGHMHAELETGGYKESGIGRLHGIEALDSFLQTKNIAWSLQRDSC